MTNKKYYTVEQFAEMTKDSWPGSPNAIRAIIFQSQKGKLNFQSAFKRFKSRMLVDIEEFWNCFEKNQQNFKGKNMDRQINKVKKDVEKGDKKKAKKDISKLLKMDKKFDKELVECHKMKKKA